MGRIEFTVLNVFLFQNNFPVGLLSNPIYIQAPNSIINVSWKPIKGMQVSLPAKVLLLCTVLSEVGLRWPINETEQRLTQSRSPCIPGAPSVVNSASTLIEGDKNTCRPLTSEAHCKDGSCSKLFEFFRRKNKCSVKIKLCYHTCWVKMKQRPCLGHVCRGAKKTTHTLD